ncbi:hypothetical protein CcaverHIS631_0406950 [Cutaneotrichosporon cavernicola]|nr:hypothetical protein CcaverHIS631_0406950 [Cutaneotrichosporon cavernicola]BEJ07426.1 hypothetical protein CcaverHIS641_0406950 [Cutaneotrichosporon cavernicola]
MNLLGADHLPSLAHFVVFNPTLARKPPKNKDAALSAAEREPRQQAEERDRDLEDDLREAAQIVFYTARNAGGVSRDRMLRQVGLAKGLMGFADMVVVDAAADTNAPVYWAIRAQHQRLLVYSPEPDWFIYINISLPRDKDKDAKDKDAPAPPPAPSDCMLVKGLQRGYEDFCLLHASLESHLPPTPAFSSLLERYWTRFAFGFEAAYLSPGPAYPLQTWLNGWPAELDDEALRDALTALIQGDAGAGLVSPKRPLMTTGTVPRGREGEALTRFLLGRLVALPPVPAPKPERHSLGFGFGRRKPPPLKKDLLKVLEAEPRKTSWGLASPLSWVGFAASAPASRTATPVPVPTPAPTAAPGLSKSVDDKTKVERATPRPTGAAHKPRWPSLGLSFGDAVGNVGAAFGLSSSPKPESRLSQEIRRNGTATPAESEASDGSDARQSEEKGDGDRAGGEEETAKPAESDPSETKSNEKQTEEVKGVATDGREAEPEDTPNPAALYAGSEASPTPSATEDHPAGIAATPLETTPGDTQAPTPVATPAELPVETSAELPDQATELATDVPLPPPPSFNLTRSDSLALSLDDAASVTGSQASVADLDAAIHSDVDMAWESRTIYLAGQQRRLCWVVRERTLLFFICPHGEDDDVLPSATAALCVFAAYSSHTETEKEKDREKPDTTVYHAGSVAESAGSMDTTESGTLAALRGFLLSGITAVLAQTPGGKFAIAKSAEEGDGELYALTGRNASLTDAERVVREFALVRPEFT